MYVFPKKVWNLHFKERVLLARNAFSFTQICGILFVFLLRTSCAPFCVTLSLHEHIQCSGLILSSAVLTSACVLRLSVTWKRVAFFSLVFQEAKCLSLNIQSYLPACIQSLLSINIILLTSGLLRTIKPWKNKGLKSGALFPFNPKFQKFWLVHCTSNEMDHFGLVWTEYLGPALKVVLFDRSGYLGLMNQNVPSHLTKLLSPLLLFRILLTRTIETFRF